MIEGQEKFLKSARGRRKHVRVTFWFSICILQSSKAICLSLLRCVYIQVDALFLTHYSPYLVKHYWWKLSISASGHLHPFSISWLNWDSKWFFFFKNPLLTKVITLCQSILIARFNLRHHSSILRLLPNFFFDISNCASFFPYVFTQLSCHSY